MALPREITVRRNDRHGSLLGNALRMLSSDKDGDILAAGRAIQRLLQSHGADIHALADHVENANGGLSEDVKKKIRSEIERARAVGYGEGVRATEARFRPEGKLEFNEVALFAERQIYRLPPDKHEFIHKMAHYARQEYEPTQKQGKFLFDLFVQYRAVYAAGGASSV